MLRTSEPRDRPQWMLEASVHQADIDYSAWSRRHVDPRTYPPIWTLTMLASVTLPGIHNRKYGVLGRTATSVWKFIRTASAVVGSGSSLESPDPDRRRAFEERPGDEVPAVHNAVAGLG